MAWSPTCFPRGAPWPALERWLAGLWEPPPREPSLRLLPLGMHSYPCKELAARAGEGQVSEGFPGSFTRLSPCEPVLSTCGTRYSHLGQGRGCLRGGSHGRLSRALGAQEGRLSPRGARAAALPPPVLPEEACVHRAGGPLGVVSGGPGVQAGSRKGRGTRDQIANIRWITGKAREFQENIYFCFTDYTEGFDCVDHNKLWKILRDGNTRPPDLPLEIKKQQLELDMEQRAGSKLGKEYIKTVYCHPAYLTYIQSTS